MLTLSVWYSHVGILDTEVQRADLSPILKQADAIRSRRHNLYIMYWKIVLFDTLEWKNECNKDMYKTPNDRNQPRKNTNKKAHQAGKKPAEPIYEHKNVKVLLIFCLVLRERIEYATISAAINIMTPRTMPTIFPVFLMAEL